MSTSSDRHGCTIRWPTRVVVATGNAGKLDEIRAALAHPGWEFVTIDEAGGWEAPRRRARRSWRTRASRRRRPTSSSVASRSPTTAGSRSMRSMGRPASTPPASRRGRDRAANNERLLGALADVPEAERTARFRCVVVLIDEDGAETVAEGTCEGRIGLEPRGEGGFGYDPLFLPDAAPGEPWPSSTWPRRTPSATGGLALAACRAALADERCSDVCPLPCGNLYCPLPSAGSRRACALATGRHGSGRGAAW